MQGNVDEEIQVTIFHSPLLSQKYPFTLSFVATKEGVKG
jgi:hypothetical protein